MHMLKTKHEQELSKGFEREDVTFGHINSLKDVANSEQYKARNLSAGVTYSDKDVSIPITAHAIKMTGVEEKSMYTAHTLGCSTFEVLGKYVDGATLHGIYDPVIEKNKKVAEETQLKGGILKR